MTFGFALGEFVCDESRAEIGECRAAQAFRRWRAKARSATTYVLRQADSCGRSRGTHADYWEIALQSREGVADSLLNDRDGRRDVCDCGPEIEFDAPSCGAGDVER